MIHRAGFEVFQEKGWLILRSPIPKNLIGHINCFFSNAKDVDADELQIHTFCIKRTSSILHRKIVKLLMQ